nr:putative aminotransferase c6b12.04c [Quercus suber]
MQSLRRASASVRQFHHQPGTISTGSARSAVFVDHSIARSFTASAMVKDPFKPAARVAGQKQDVWSIVNEAAQASPVQPIVNMGQGFFGYNPPDFVLNAAKDAIDRVECNQYSPTKGRPRLKKAIADAYSPLFGRTIDPDTEVTITTGANEGMLSAFMGFLEQGDEVIVFEPFFDQYISNIEMPGGKVVYVPLTPPKGGATKNTSAGDWVVDMSELEQKITDRTRMMVLNSPHNPVGKVFTRDELQAIGDLCVKHNIIILSDEVYDSLYYTEFTRIATLSPEIEKLTLTVGSAGKNFWVTGWRVGYLIGQEHLIKYVAAAHTRICYSSVSPLQEAVAVAFEQAEANNFWERSKTEMKSKMDRFNEIWKELDLPYSDPQGGYFVLVNLSKVKLPEDYEFPPHVASRPRDFKLSWFCIKELGVAAIPPTEFFTDANAHIVEDWLRFAELNAANPWVSRSNPCNSVANLEANLRLAGCSSLLHSTFHLPSSHLQHLLHILPHLGNPAHHLARQHISEFGKRLATAQHLLIIPHDQLHEFTRVDVWITTSLHILDDIHGKVGGEVFRGFDERDEVGDQRFDLGAHRRARRRAIVVVGLHHQQVEVRDAGAQRGVDGRLAGRRHGRGQLIHG